MVHLMVINKIRQGKVKESEEVYADCIRIMQKHECKVFGVWKNWIGGIQEKV